MDTTRIHEIKSLPDFMQEDAVVDMPTAAILLSTCLPSARKIVRENKLNVVQISERKTGVRWGVLRKFILDRERPATAAA
jgi:hypothetical protein